MKKLLFVLLASSLTACSSGGNILSNNILSNNLPSLETQFSNVTELTTQLRSQQLKSVALNDLQFQMLSLDGNNRVDISANSPVVNFPEGNSFVGALLLPDRISAFSFSMESIAGNTIFVPSVIFLDENFQKVSSIDDAKLTDKGFLSVEKSLSSENTKPIRYILIYTKDSELNGKTKLINVAREYEENKGMDVAENTFPDVYVRHSPVGNLNVQLKNVFFSAPAVAKNTVAFKAESTMPSSTEDAFLQDISDAVKQDNISKALQLVEKAENAGSTKAQAYFIEALKKQQK